MRVQSSEAETTRLLSPVTQTDRTKSSCPRNVDRQAMVLVSQILTVLSPEPLQIVVPSLETAMPLTHSSWPRRAHLHSRSLTSQTRIARSKDPERMLFPSGEKHTVQTSLVDCPSRAPIIFPVWRS